MLSEEEGTLLGSYLLSFSKLHLLPLYNVFPFWTLYPASTLSTLSVVDPRNGIGLVLTNINALLRIDNDVI